MLLGGSGVRFHGYGWLTRTFTGGDRPLVGLLLLAAGGVIGYGAKTATGCTSGNGLSGCSLASGRELYSRRERARASEPTLEREPALRAAHPAVSAAQPQ